MAQYICLKNQDGSFSDFPNSDFTISRDEVKLLPEPHSLRITDWLNAGGFVFCDAPEGASPEPGGEASLDILSDVASAAALVEEVKEVTTPDSAEEPEEVKPDVPVVKPKNKGGRPRKKI